MSTREEKEGRSEGVKEGRRKKEEEGGGRK
jgi:hypothetical protein